MMGRSKNPKTVLSKSTIIYLILVIPKNGKSVLYAGVTTQPKRRLADHKRYLENPDKHKGRIGRLRRLYDAVPGSQVFMAVIAEFGKDAHPAFLWDGELLITQLARTMVLI